MAPQVLAHRRIMLLSLVFVLCAKADVVSKGAHGLVGLGISYYDPKCAFACTGSVSAPLNCTTADHTQETGLLKRSQIGEVFEYPYGNGWNVTAAVTPACQANSEFYLQTVAYCLKTRCEGLLVSKLQTFWEQQIPKRKDGTQKSYAQILDDITSTPTRLLNTSEHLNYTAIVPEELYQVSRNNIQGAVISEISHTKYSVILFITGAVLPIAMSLLRFLPWPASWITKFNAYLIDPPLIGKHHSTPILGVGIMPTRGQAFFIAYLWLINIFLSTCGYRVIMPNSWYASAQIQLKRYIANRLGVLCYSNIPLVILYAGRNNVLIWLTNWSHSTFLLLHRWLAVICLVQGIVHSLAFLNIAQIADGWETEFHEPYWAYGAVAVVFFAVLCVSAMYPVRKRLYEVFLALHIMVTIAALVLSFKHVVVKYGYTWGFQNWIYTACAIWAFDRFMRLARTTRNGLKRAHFSAIDDEYYRLDIPGVSAEGHVYLHFPTVSKWRVWESHPFSVAGISYGKDHSAVCKNETITNEKGPESDSDAVAASSPSTSKSDIRFTPRQGLGLVVFIRKQGGLTSQLTRKEYSPKGIPVLVEGSYAQGVTFLQEKEATPTTEYPNLLCIAGGVGITGVLPALDRYNQVGGALGSRRLLWGARTWPLVREVESMLGHSSRDNLATSRKWGGIDVSLAVGERLDLRTLLSKDLRAQVGGTTVVVCGPAAMVDDVRRIVSALARHNDDGKPLRVRLLIESFTW